MAQGLAWSLCALTLIVGPTSVFSARVQQASNVDESESDVLSENTHSLQAGMFLRGRYELVRFVERQKLPERPGQQFPVKTRAVDGAVRFRNASHLGQGSFGDVWKAVDRNDPDRRAVAIKIFYTKAKGYLTWRNADAWEQQDLKSNANECKLARDMVSQAPGALGNNRICNCFEEHVNDARGTNRAVFLVQENCGPSLHSFYWKKGKGKNLAKARELTKQMLEGLAYFMNFNPPLIHHDLKPANVCVNDEGIKIIDFGALVLASAEAQREPAVATPLYTPPEVGRARAFDFPAHSYDVYAVGLIYMEMLCPAMQHNDWYYSREYLGQKTTIRNALKKRCREYGGTGRERNAIDKDIDLIVKMVGSNPRRRPSPTEALEHEALTPKVKAVRVPVPKVPSVKPEVFREGDLVEYWSPSYKTWMEAVVRYVHDDGRHLDLDNDSGARLKKGASIGQVRRREVKMEFKVGDKVGFKYEATIWLDADIRAVVPGKGYHVRYSLDGTTRYAFAKRDEVRARQARVDPGLLRNSADQVRRGLTSPQKPEERGVIIPDIDDAADDAGADPQSSVALRDYQISSWVSVLEPELAQFSQVLKIKVQAVCDQRFLCTCDKILVVCHGAQAWATREMQLWKPGQIARRHYGTLYLTKGDPWMGKTCSVRAYVSATDANGAKKFKSFVRSMKIPRQSGYGY